MSNKKPILPQLQWWVMELLELLLLILNLCLVLCPSCGILVINCVVGILFGLQEFGFWYTWFTVCAFICRCEKIYLSLLLILAWKITCYKGIIY
ncbi:hypothetical protein RchiOBHm_Chr5g0030231 [Rosa chinensis]|uniref:Transmembrane protein n=1 Tax=Rosa chinensis TaxID=74649 RepID=A0A2P6Q9T8_ROSCH|nr:hypothetical protein RchiOBHm_Chr5g0030231 [Rosa chinensis]